MMSHPTAVAQVLRLLEANGVTNAVARAAGPEFEIAVIEAPRSAMQTLAALAPAIRALGFRYVTLDLGGAGDDAA